MNDTEDDGVVTVDRFEYTGDRLTSASDALAGEEPLEIRLGGIPIAVVMRTPGHDDDLVRGFLVSERIVPSPDVIASVRHCSQTATDNVVQVVLTPEHTVDLAQFSRNFYASSSCGLCGKASIDRVMLELAPAAAGPYVAADVLVRLPERLRTQQVIFERTGGLHGAGLFELDGTPVVVREDIGRHNAVDKVFGFATRSCWPPPPILAISGRISFEIVQKAAVAGIRIIVAVSAPSSLAVELGHRANLTLAGFVRAGRMAVYSGLERVMAHSGEGREKPSLSSSPGRGTKH